VTVLEELNAGRPGPALWALLKRTVFAVGVGHNFPPPGGGTWTADDVSSVAAAFLADGQTPRRLADLALHCRNDAAVARRLQGAVRNFLRDLGRATDVGRLVVRLRRALRESAAFVNVDGDRWAIVGRRADASTAAPEKLVAAAADVDVVLPSWSSTARRRAPFADKSSIEELLRATLDAADGSLTAPELALAIAPRLAVAPRPLLVEVDVGDYPEVAIGLSADATGEEVVNRLRAEEVVALLTDRERIAIAYTELAVRDLGPKMGVKSSQAHVIRQRAVDVIREELLDEDEGEQIAEMVIELARMLVERPDTALG
jgi:hypothetical protein